MPTRREFSRTAAGTGLGAALAAMAGARPIDAEPLPPAGSWTNVRDHGATGNGETDDTAAIQAAFDEQPGVVYLPAGRYLVSRSIRVRSRTSILGDSPRATTIASRITDGSAALEIGFPDYSKRLRGVRLADFAVRGDGPGRRGSGGIRLHAFYDALVQNVHMSRLGWGLEGNRAIAVQFDNLGVSGMRAGAGQSGEGVYLYGQSNACLFNKYRGIGNDGAAFRLGYGQNLTLSTPIIESNKSTAIVTGRQQDGTFVNCRAVTILNPYFEKNRPYDMTFWRGTSPLLMGGYWGPTHGDYVAAIDYHLGMTAVGCRFPGPPGGAVRIDQKNARILFLGCEFTGKVATFTRRRYRNTAALRLVDAEGDRIIGGAGG